MKINLNNRQEEIDAEEITISELLSLKSFTFKMLIIKINGSLVSKSQYTEALVRDGDQVEVIHLISGG